MTYLAIVDLDGPPEACAPGLVSNWLNSAEPGCLLRVAVNEVESWLLADAQGMGQYLGIQSNRIDNLPDTLTDPKQYLINLARTSRRTVAKGIVPEHGASASEGRLYTPNLAAFVRSSWDIDAACERSPSLDGCLNRLRDL